ncbi:EAL domain-containing protein [Herbaspirillum sp. ST 5-3]|uniref:EAL domain-containing protein n=1 Tax=Oxalobacteraceae TaxID=75682 RepID=UPI0010A533CD|nr:EAL domain-containing protein [Herbaspirillum sp. ST 5-3]
MRPNHTLLLRQLKKLGIDLAGAPPDREQWLQFLDRVNRAYTEADQERYLIERTQDISSREMQELYNRLEEAQRIAGLGNWSFQRGEPKGHWSEECFRIFGEDASSPAPSYRQFLRRVQRQDRVRLQEVAHAALNDGKDFEIEFRLQLPNGETRWARALGQAVIRRDKSVDRLHGTIMDITRRKQVEMRQYVEHTVTRLLAESDVLEETMPRIIETICETLGWPCGALWLLKRQENLFERAFTWSIGNRRVEDFFHNSKRTIALPACGGLIGRVLKRGEPAWISDVTADSQFPRAGAACEAGLRAAFAFPIQAGGDIIGVMEFFSKHTQNVDSEMLNSAHFIGRHIGQFFRRRQTEQALRESEAHFRSVVEQASDSFYIHDIEGRIIDVNQRGCDSLGYTRAELLSMTVMHIDADLSLSDLKYLQNQAEKGAPIAVESRHRRKDGISFPVEIRMGPINIDGQQHWLSLARDITERKELENHIQHLAYHDSLTDLPNRAMFNRHLQHAIAHAQRNNTRLAVLFIDLDRFKNVNDTLGHNAGDRLLQEMGRRIGSCLHGSDFVARFGHEDLVARLGGDEFVVLIEEVSDTSQVAGIAHKILAAMVKEYPLDGQLIHMTASIGISLFPDDGRNEFSLMKHADIAMYRAKETGKNSFQFYSANMDAYSAKLLALESGLRRAIERGELLLYYQPKVDARNGRVSGAEALVRWRHPDLGLISPAHFIPLAEETGLIVPLSQWVLRESCRQNLAWQQQGLPPMRIAVNLSARQFTDDNLIADTARVLREIGIDPSLVEIEITESMMMYNTDKTVHMLSALRELGISIAIDDFGIGYSSLSHLKHFPLDIIKIDRSFIKDVPGDLSDAAIADAIIAMAKRMQVKVVAEGVETAAQLDFLRERGCDEIQGNYFSKPLSPENFFAFASTRMPGATLLTDPS